MTTIRQMAPFIATLALVPFGVQAHEVNVDIPFTPQEEVAGVNARPFPLEMYYSGEAGELFSRSNCYVPQDRLRDYAIGQWLEDPIEQRIRLVCAIVMLSRGPQNLVASGGREPGAEFLESTVISVSILADTFLAPDNLSAVQAISASLVVLGGLTPGDQRALVRSVLE
ncbi:hypothetical protein [Roseobacter sp. CCS2]|uniref:hypothetical protein n=1 Tax=Roseobacter sp. CCS2 TaxID=391593 RepID=UPI0000F401DB|nr:hypothetical protein [Roseobacter sp. CCS2]EBA13877.1 hypothetical protein RCCS2_08309 [Roseobacter sp. CCS2]